jgi:hypothetical protein
MPRFSDYMKTKFGHLFPKLSTENALKPSHSDWKIDVRVFNAVYVNASICAKKLKLTSSDSIISLFTIQ